MKRLVHVSNEKNPSISETCWGIKDKLFSVFRAKVFMNVKSKFGVHLDGFLSGQ